MHPSRSCNPTTIPPFATMGRKEFMGFLHDLYECERRKVSNDAEADLTISDVIEVELLLTPQGPLLAVHHGKMPRDTVTVMRLDLSGLTELASVAATA